ncbi:hypothetical protein [Rhodococcus opacus]|uniref:Hypothetical membrane protein n=1 Tax=Rhodococcus opacus (strain B4) TaxID=632772 RepID=C1AR52_RHOOB|nr:hypothetical protein [Rhodococcus opacus]BAH48529.1 hypothetical membrane protein [Rhodococcus opacus B4]
MHSDTRIRETLHGHTKVTGRFALADVALTTFVCLVCATGIGIITGSVLAAATGGLIVVLATALMVAAV